MSLKIDPSGRRSVQVEVEVQGSSDEVWTAIGTGPGISCWFVPTEFDTLGSVDISVQPYENSSEL